MHAERLTHIRSYRTEIAQPAQLVYLCSPVAGVRALTLELGQTLNIIKGHTGSVLGLLSSLLLQASLKLLKTSSAPLLVRRIWISCHGSRGSLRGMCVHL